MKKENASTKVGRPDALYTQPEKVKKKQKSTRKDSQVNRTEEVPAPCGDMYTKPALTKKKDKRSQLQYYNIRAGALTSNA